MRTSSVMLTVRLFYIVAIFWALFAGYWLLSESAYRLAYSGMAVVNAGLLSLLGYHLAQRKQWARWGAILVLGFNIITTLTDQMGWFDWLYLVPAVGLLIMVILLRFPERGVSATSDLTK